MVHDVKIPIDCSLRRNVTILLSILFQISILLTKCSNGEVSFTSSRNDNNTINDDNSIEIGEQILTSLLNMKIFSRKALPLY